MWQWNRSHQRAPQRTGTSSAANAPGDNLDAAATGTRWGKTTLTVLGALIAAGVAGTIGRELGRDGYRYVFPPSQAQKDAALAKGMGIALVDLRKTLPNRLDATTTLTDVKLSGTTMTYVNTISADYEVTNIHARAPAAAGDGIQLLACVLASLD